MLCPACQTEVVPESLFCHKCGQRLGLEPLAAHRDTPGVAAQPNTGNPPQNLLGPKGLPVEPERELWRGGYSSKAMLGGWALSGLVTIVLLAVGVWWQPIWQWWAALVGAAILLWLYHVLLLAYRRMTVRYLLTNQRFIHEVGLLRRLTSRIEVLDMDDISFEQSLIERLVGVGTIRILSSDRSDPEFHLIGIANVRQVAEQFDDARRTERRRHGLHIEQI